MTLADKDIHQANAPQLSDKSLDAADVSAAHIEMLTIQLNAYRRAMTSLGVFLMQEGIVGVTDWTDLLMHSLDDAPTNPKDRAEVQRYEQAAADALERAKMKLGPRPTFDPILTLIQGGLSGMPSPKLRD